ncbi:PBPRA1643 family SWIM/SEC-C metal-binding motif protein [Candidatus Latescibacterota bacterium]
MEKPFNGPKKSKLGTKKKPAVLRVQTEERMKEIASQCEANGWTCTIEVDKDKPEDIADFELLLNPPGTRTVDKKIGRNELCPCGSGKKYKNCCGK